MKQFAQDLFMPFGVIDKKTRIGVILFWAALFFVLLETLHSPVIPAPTRILGSFITIVSSKDFYDDLLSSLWFTSKGMFYSLLLTMVIVYVSPIQIFKPLSQLVSKFRYLTITGLVFLFSVLSTNVSDMKMNLLLFGIIPFFVTSFLGVVGSIDQMEMNKSYVNKNNKWETLLEIVIIGRLDQLLVVASQNFAIAWMMITAVEGFAMNEGGIGTLIIKGNKTMNLSNVFAILIIVLIIGLLFDYLLSQLRFLLFPYTKR